MRPISLSRRSVLAGLGAALSGFAVRARAAGLGGAALATDFGVDPASGADQTAALQHAIEAAASEGRGLFLPGGTYRVATLRLDGTFAIGGVPGVTRIVASSDRPMLASRGADAITLEGIEFDGASIGPDSGRTGLMSIENCGRLWLDRIAVRNTAGTGLHMNSVAGEISGCEFADIAATAVFSLDARGLRIAGNAVAGCGNGGIRIWRQSAGTDGSIVTGNRIAGIASLAGGSGQNGNGINVFRADGVIVADNHISDCAFSAVRVNAARDSLIRGNSCQAVSEVAIFSEFGFSGSVIADNVVDGASGGISMTNFDQGGRLATCSGNLVRNILAESPTNPDASPFGIFAEADTAISGNVVEAVPGPGIGAGWGPYLRDVAVTGNVVRDARIGIAVSVAEGAGAASVTGNLVSGARLAAIAGMRWSDIAEPDLAANADRYPNLSVSGNLVR